LRAYYADETLPAPRQTTQAETDAVREALQTPEVNRGLPLVFQMLYDLLF